MNPKQIENKFYAARNSEFDTDEVKNIVHKETNDAEYGIDKERLSNKSFKFNAYFAWKGERVQSARFNTREDAQRWIDKQVAKRHPNKRFSRPGVKDTMAMKMKDEDVRALAEAVRKVISNNPKVTRARYRDAGMSDTRWMFDVYHAATRYLPSDWRRRVYAYLNDANIETALKTITKQYASRPGQPEQFAKQVISTRGNKRAEISGPDGSGQWRAYVIQKSPTGLPSEPYHEDLLGDMKFFDTEEKARRAASKMLASRPGAKDTMASHKEGFQKEYVLWALPKGETDRLEERPIAEGITTPQQMDDAKRKAAAQGWHGFRVQILDMSKPFRWMSRPGVKDTMALEDRFYFGKDRFELSFNRAEVERAKSELRSLVDVHRRLASKSEGVKSAKHGVIADVLARLINQGPEVLAAIGFRKASYWNARAMELANASSSGYGPILKTLISEAEREYRRH